MGPQQFASCGSGHPDRIQHWRSNAVQDPASSSAVEASFPNFSGQPAASTARSLIHLYRRPALPPTRPARAPDREPSGASVVRSSPDSAKSSRRDRPAVVTRRRYHTMPVGADGGRLTFVLWILWLLSFTRLSSTSVRSSGNLARATRKYHRKEPEPARRTAHESPDDDQCVVATASARGALAVIAPR